MSVRQIADRAELAYAPKKRKPARSRTGWFAVTVLSGGAMAGIAALLGIWPFAGAPALVASIIRPETPGALTALSLFPPVQPIHNVVDVYDPAPPAAPHAANSAAPAPGTAGPVRPTGQPIQTGGPFPVIIFPAGPMSAIEATCEAAKQAAQRQSAAYQQNVERQCEAAKQAYERAHP